MHSLKLIELKESQTHSNKAFWIKWRWKAFNKANWIECESQMNSKKANWIKWKWNAFNKANWIKRKSNTFNQNFLNQMKVKSIQQS
jgi:hypothetical protein